MPTDPRPQGAPPVTQGGTNRTAFRGPYVDQGLTLRNPPDVAITPTPAKSGSATLGGIRNFYANDRAHEIENTATNPDATAPEHAGNRWQIEDDSAGIPRSRDFYRNNGMIGQDFLMNQG